MRRLLVVLLIAACLLPDAEPAQAQATGDQFDKLSLEALTAPAPGGNPGPYRHSIRRPSYRGYAHRGSAYRSPAYRGAVYRRAARGRRPYARHAYARQTRLHRRSGYRAARAPSYAPAARGSRHRYSYQAAQHPRRRR